MFLTKKKGGRLLFVSFAREPRALLRERGVNKTAKRPYAKKGREQGRELDVCEIRREQGREAVACKKGGVEKVTCKKGDVNKATKSNFRLRRSALRPGGPSASTSTGLHVAGAKTFGKKEGVSKGFGAKWAREDIQIFNRNKTKQ